MVMMHIVVVTYAYIRIYNHIYVTVYVRSVSHLLSIIGTHSQLSMEQKWCIFKQARWFV